MVAYLDAAATTRVLPEVAEVVLHWMSEDFGNAGSRTHGYGTRAKKAVARARESIAAHLAARPDELIFTSGATESNNIAILGLAAHGSKHGRRHIISSAIEHKAVLEPLEHLQSRGFEVELIEPGPSGRVSEEAVLERLRPDTLLVSIMQVNNETGIIQPVAALAEHLRSTPTYFHVDAAQGFGKLPDGLRAPIDLISFSGHKVGAPKGVGGLLIRRRGRDTVPLTPLMFGGGQERKLRPGTLPVPLIMGLAKALEVFEADRAKWLAAAEEFRSRLLTGLGKTRFHLHGDQDHVVPHILNLSFDDVDTEALILQLKSYAAVATGSACTSASYTPSHVLAAMGLPEQQASNGLRLSWFPDQANELDIDEFTSVIADYQSGIISA
ncbi:putative L-cysteine desulfurase [Planomonospora parontospora subsp. parontospora]|uniref:cysteine desulfurase n=2 Tax=Planomonospora parontospora TaxID=58119 RepID=A0AA37F1Z9_9ACTN|nr:cysteine desulfurase DndA [Planomonospora parontospora]GGK44987.1 putative L-cysteine desulfurase [Planomonospora parontospora]GII06269.1 putative L-cysteine desulfurase [Planomonospora parontospora subsp. parontospora]